MVAAIVSFLAFTATTTYADNARSADDEPVLKLFRTLVDEAFARKANGDLVEALAQFQLALTSIRHKRGESWNKRRYGVMYQRIQILMALKRFEEAGTQLAVMKELPGLTTAEREALRKTSQNIDRMIRSAALKRPLTVLVVVEDASGTPLAADVRLDGQRIGQAPVTVTRPPGDYRVTMTLSGYRTHRGVIQVAPNGPARATVVLERAAEPDGPVTDYTAALATGGVGLGLLLIGGVVHGLAHENFVFADAPGTFRPDAVKAVDQGNDLTAAALACYGIGGAAVVTAIVLAAVASETPAGSDTTMIQIRPARGALVVGVGGAW